MIFENSKFSIFQKGVKKSGGGSSDIAFISYGMVDPSKLLAWGHVTFSSIAPVTTQKLLVSLLASWWPVPITARDWPPRCWGTSTSDHDRLRPQPATICNSRGLQPRSRGLRGIFQWQRARGMAFRRRPIGKFAILSAALTHGYWKSARTLWQQPILLYLQSVFSVNGQYI